MRACLAKNPRITLYFTPPSGVRSLRRKTEKQRSFGYNRQATRHGSFTSVKDLLAAVGNFTGGWNDRCHPFTWTKTANLPRCKHG